MLKFLLKAGIAAAGVGIALDLLRRREQNASPEVKENLDQAKNRAKDAADAAREAAEAAVKAQTAQMKADSEVFAQTMNKVKEDTIANAEKAGEIFEEMKKAAQQDVDTAEAEAKKAADAAKEELDAAKETVKEGMAEADKVIKEEMKADEEEAKKSEEEVSEDARAALTEAEDAAILADGGELELPAPEPVPADEYPEVIDNKDDDKETK